MQFASIQPRDRALSGDITPGQSWPESNDNKGVLCISRSPSITGTPPSDCFGGARGVVVIVVGKGHGDTSSNPGRDWLHFT